MANAQTSPLSMDEILAALDSTSPVLAAARAELALARAELTSNRAVPNPTLFVEENQPAKHSTEPRESTIGGRQELGFLWSLPTRISAGNRAYQAGLAAYAETRAALEVEVLITGYQVTSLRQQLALLDTVLALGRHLENVALARKQAGEISGFDVQRVRAEVLELTSERAVLSAMFSTSIAHLIDLTGLPDHALAEFPVPDAGDPPFDSAEEAAQYARKYRPLVAQTQHELAAARSAVSAARWDMLPKFSIGLGRKTAEGNLQGTVWEAELEVPLFQQRRTTLNVLRARREYAERNRIAKERAIEQEARNYFNEWQALRQTDSGRTQVPAADARRNVENASLLYTAGKLSALELVDALRTGFEAYAAAAELGERKLAATIHLRRAAGLPVWEGRHDHIETNKE